jgi:hypothetical protein
MDWIHACLRVGFENGAEMFYALILVDYLESLFVCPLYAFSGVKLVACRRAYSLMDYS